MGHPGAIWSVSQNAPQKISIGADRYSMPYKTPKYGAFYGAFGSANAAYPKGRIRIDTAFSLDGYGIGRGLGMRLVPTPWTE